MGSAKDAVAAFLGLVLLLSDFSLPCEVVESSPCAIMAIASLFLSVLDADMAVEFLESAGRFFVSSSDSSAVNIFIVEFCTCKIYQASGI